MIRIGMIGSDNSHSIAFSKLANLEAGEGEFKVEGAAVTHIYGTDPARTQEVAEQGRIPTIVEHLEDMVGEVDAVICVWRHGGKHLADTAPFLKAGVPAFVDKPLTCSVDEGRELIALAQEHGVGLTSFSTLRFAQPTVEFVTGLREKTGEALYGSVAGPAELDSEYGGVFFYGIHTVELLNAVWGYGCTHVQAVAHGQGAAVTCVFDDERLVTLQLMSGVPYGWQITAFGESAWETHRVDSKRAYFDGMTTFMETFRDGTWIFTPDELLEPVKILTAIEQSLPDGREIALADL